MAVNRNLVSPCGNAPGGGVNSLTVTKTSDPATQLVMYTTPWCGYCRRLKTQLTADGIAYTEVNIEEVPEAATFVEQVNGGNQTVPTVVFPDGSAATNPSLRDVKERLGL